MGISYKKNISKKKLVQFLREVDDYFVPKLSDRVDIIQYAKKLKENAAFIIAKNNKEVVGLIVFYCNDENLKNAYLPLMAVKIEYRGLKISNILFKRALKFIKKKNYQALYLETWAGNWAKLFYEKYGAFVYKTIEENKRKSLKMKILFVDDMFSNNNTSTLQISKRIGTHYNINLFIKRDDLLPVAGGGNKVRKLEYILNKAKKEGFNALVTAGSNQSNHLRVSSIRAAELGWKSILVVHDNRPETIEGNLKICDLTGAEIRFVKMADVKVEMDKAITDLRNENLKPLYIWGGGHSVEGALSYYDAVFELRKQLGNVIPDYIVLASGTGTTQAGIEVGVRQIYPKCKVLGISVARDEKRGKEEVFKSFNELNKHLGFPIEKNNKIHFNDTVMGNGYEDTYPDLINLIHWAAKKEGLILDPTYTGKAFMGLQKYIEKGIIEKESNVIFWHTGGLLNLMATNKL